MLIEITAIEAERLVADTYAGASKPLTSGKNAENSGSLDWWLEKPRTEATGTPRQKAGVEGLLEIAKHASVDLPHGTFPALMEFTDGEKRMPDKGQVKALMRSGWLCARIHQTELVFQLTKLAETE